MNTLREKIGLLGAALLLASISITAAIGPAVHNAPLVA